MKTLFTLIAIVLCFVSVTFGQTTVFPKNQEAAIANKHQNLSETITTVFVSEQPISPDQYSNLVGIMEFKDGYVSCTLSQQQITLIHEDWLKVKDILDVMKGAGIIAELKGVMDRSEQE